MNEADRIPTPSLKAGEVLVIRPGAALLTGALAPTLAQALAAAQRWEHETAGSLAELHAEAHRTANFTEYDEARADTNETGVELLGQVLAAHRGEAGR